MLDKWRRARRLRRSLSESVVFGEGLKVGDRTRVWAPQKLEIGAEVALGSDVRIEVDGIIGDHVLIANRVGVVGRADHAIKEVGLSVRQSSWVGTSPSLSFPVVIGSDVWIGYGATILSGVTIGDSSIIGAGAVVTTDVPQNSIAVGTPARVIGSRFDEDQFDRHWELLRRSGIRRIARLVGGSEA